MKSEFAQYVADASTINDRMGFVLQHFKGSPKVARTVEGLESLESFYWGRSSEMDGAIIDPPGFLWMLGQLLGETIIERTSARWQQSVERNRSFPQPCICGFGEEAWERVYPVTLAQAYHDIVSSQPQFPGVRGRRIFAAQLEKALTIDAKRATHQAQQAGTGQPATRLVDEPEGGDKLQPEAEGRSR